MKVRTPSHSVAGLGCRLACALFVIVLGALAACESASSSIVTSDPQRYKLFVQQTGMYRVTVDALARAGANVSQIDAATLQLFHGETELPIRVNGAGHDLAIAFYGQTSESPYSAFNVYWLRWNVATGKRMADSAVATSATSAQTTYAETVTVGPSVARDAQPTLYVPQAGGEHEHWFWQALSAPLTTTIAVTLSASVPAPAQLQVRVWGSSQDAADPDHHVRIALNDQIIGDDAWDGQGAHMITAIIPPDLVRDGVLPLQLIAPGDTKAKVDVLLLRDVSVTHIRRLTAQADTLEFVGDSDAYRVDGFSGDAVDVFDVSAPDAPLQVANVTRASRAVTFTASGERRWFAVGPSGYRTVSSIRAMPPSALRASDGLKNHFRQADYIVVTPLQFAQAAQPLVRWREQHGLRVAVATTDDIYNEFGFGTESPTAIRDFLAYAFRNWPKPAPRFVLLVGKASYDTRDMLHAPNKNLLPTFLRSTLNLGETGDDNAFVVFDEASPAPQMAIGRLPVKTDAQLATVIEKIIAYESAGAADWRGRALFIADDKDSDFETMSEDFIGRLPQGVTVTRAYLRANPVVSGTNGGGAASGGLVPTKQAIVTNWNQGAALVSYVGHGSITLWAAGPLFAASDANALRNAERLPFLLTPTCLDGYFLDAQQDSLAEQLLFKPDGGIIGGFVPTGLSFSASQRKLATGFLDALFQSPPPTVGEAIMRAKQAMPSPDRADAEVIETFTLLGDPALTLVIGR